MYTCTSRVLKVQDVPIESLLLEHPAEVKHNERRQFYRLLTSITPRYAARTNKEGDEPTGSTSASSTSAAVACRCA